MTEEEKKLLITLDRPGPPRPEEGGNRDVPELFAYLL